MVLDPLSIGLSLLPIFLGGQKQDTNQIYSQYQQDVAKRPDYTYLNQDPMVQNLQRQGVTSRNQAMQQAMSQLIRSGFGRSNIGAATAGAVGTQAQTPYTNNMASMLSNLQNNAEQNRLQALRDVLQGRLGQATQQNQASSGMQLAGFTDLLKQFQPKAKFDTTTGKALFDPMTGRAY